jgi:thiamine pyrophosphokinase
MQPGPDATPRHVVVIADGDVPPRAALDSAWAGWDADVAEVIAADGGFARAQAIGFRPALLVGDLDSLAPWLVGEAEAAGVDVLRAPVAKDESDAELALLAAVERGATRITVLGAFGGTRLDHGLANIWLLAHPALRSVSTVLVDERTRVSLISAPGPDGGPVTRILAGPVGATVSLLPLGGDVTGVTTDGLQYPLQREPLLVGPARGLSNVRERADARLTVEHGRLLVVESVLRPAGLSSEP